MINIPVGRGLVLVAGVALGVGVDNGFFLVGHVLGQQGLFARQFFEDV